MTNKKMSIFYLGLLSSFPLLTFDLYQPALPRMTEFFNTTHVLGQLTLGINLIFYGIGQVIWGPLLDHYGRRKILPISLFLFILSTLICIFAVTIDMMLIGRAGQGFFCSCAHVLAFSSARDTSDKREMARTFSYLVMFLAISPMIGPIIGGFIFVYSNWQMLFITMILIATVILLMGMNMLIESPYFTKKNERLRLASALKHDVMVTKLPLVRKSLIMQTVTFSCLMVVLFNISYFVIDNLNYEPQQLSYFFAVNGIIIIIGHTLGIKLRKHFSLVFNIRLGSLIMLLGASLMVISTYFTGLSILTICLFYVNNIGATLLNPPTATLALSEMPRYAASITGIINTFRSIVSSGLASLIGIAVTFSFYSFSLSLFILTTIAVLTAFFGYKESDGMQDI